MQLKQKNWYRAGSPPLWTVEGAVSQDIIEGCYGCPGQLEEIEAKVEKLTDFVARLTSLLHERSILTDEMILALLPDMEVAFPTVQK